MIKWICTVEAVNAAYTGDVEDLAETVVDRLGPDHATATFGQGRIVATFTVEGRLALQAADKALRAWSKVLDDQLAWSVVSLTTRRADQPDDVPGMPELLGVAEVAKRLDVSKQRVTELAREHQLFPHPLAELASGPVWTAWQIGAFEESWPRKTGRPLRRTSDE